MRRAVLVLMLAIAPCMGLADELRGRVVGVADGDTLTVLDAWRQQIKVRLAEIDAPEKAQPYGQRSKQALSGLCYGREAIVDHTGRDRYGRTIGRVRCGGVDANAGQIKRGNSFHIPDPQIVIGTALIDAKKHLPGIDRVGQRV